jgi:hypothetical protein
MIARWRVTELSLARIFKCTMAVARGNTRFQGIENIIEGEAIINLMRAAASAPWRYQPAGGSASGWLSYDTAHGGQLSLVSALARWFSGRP